ncbi:cytochrome P450 87A3 [Artemisia annua]|uniref:Cytochrome P450 87A3 n=1 Tax=Artemisia annua TaxID=35608 RepID=A0A2U1K9L5_ARTAN|nr:cytochrome P450 87A3 [Artemisia annua]
MERYGSIFKTSLVGVQVIVSTDSDLNSLVFKKEDEVFQSWWPNSMTEVFGRTNLSTLYGGLHKFTKNMVLNQFGPERLKEMLSEIESVSKIHLARWAQKGTVEVKTAASDMILSFAAKKLISHDLDKSLENMRENFEAFITGLISFPIAIPGTAYYKCLQV